MLKKSSLAVVLFLLAAAPTLARSPLEALQKAAKKGKPALMLVTAPGVGNLDAAKATIADAARQIKGCVTLEMDRADTNNAPLVSQYGLAGAPLPLILVFADNGALAGGMPSAQATPTTLVGLIPSPKKAEVLKALQAGNAVLLVASKKSMKEQTAAMEKCSLACGQIKGKSATVQVDMGDSAEQKFLTEMKVNTASQVPVILTINPQGQVTGTFRGDADVAALAQAATKKAGGCCPKGSGASCGPAKK